MSGVTVPPWRSRFYLASGKVREQVNCVVSSMHQACPLYPQLLTYRCGAANRRFGPVTEVRPPKVPISSRTLICRIFSNRQRPSLILKPEHHELPKLIGDDRENKQDADRHLLEVGLDLREIHPVLNEADEDGAEHDIADAPDPAAQTHSADDACRDRIKWHRGADICLAGFKPRGQQSPCYRGEGSAQHIGQKQVQPRVNTGETIGPIPGTVMRRLASSS